MTTEQKVAISEREHGDQTRSAWQWPRPCPTCGQGVHPRLWPAHVNFHKAEAGGQIPLFGDVQWVTSP